MDVFRGCVPEGAEKHQLRSGGLQGVQAVPVEETERLVPGHGDPALRGRGGRRRNRPGLRCQVKQPGEINGLFHLPGDSGKAMLKTRHLVGEDQPQVAALQDRFVHRRQIAQNPDAGLCQNGLPMGVQHGFAVGEDHTGNMTGRAKVQHPLDLCRQGQADPLGAEDQDHGQVRQVRHLPGTGLVGAVYPVVIAHGSLHQGELGGLPGQGVSHPFGALKKEVQVPAGQAQDLTVEHGVDIIRAALEALHGQAPVLKGPEKAAGHHGLAAAAVHGGEHETLHGRPPVIRKMGFWARSRCFPPAGLVRLTESCVTSGSKPKADISSRDSWAVSRVMAETQIRRLGF